MGSKLRTPGDPPWRVGVAGDQRVVLVVLEGQVHLLLQGLGHAVHIVEGVGEMGDLEMLLGDRRAIPRRSVAAPFR